LEKQRVQASRAFFGIFEYALDNLKKVKMIPAPYQGHASAAWLCCQ
jgi:hypothetical protein